MDKEIRSIQGNIQVVKRDDTNEPKQIQGYAILFNSYSANLGGFIEVVKPSAMNGVDLSQVQLIYGHENNSILARADSGSLELKVDEKGLFFVATLADTSLANDVYADILAGNLKGMSFGFTIANDGDDWIFDEGDTAIHVVNQIDEVFELTVTPNPAYQDTSVTVKRSLKQAKEVRNRMDEEKFMSLIKRALSEKDKDDEKETEPDAPTDHKPADDKDKEDDKSNSEGQDDEKKHDRDDEPDENVDDVEIPDEPEERANTKEKEERDTHMPKAINKPEMNERSAFNKFLKRDLSITDGTTTKGNELAIPHDILQPIERPANTNSIISLANIVSVNAPSGTVPIMAATDIKLATAEELAENPQIAKLQLAGVEYKLDTKRGYIPVSQEFIDDADANVNVETLIGDYATQIRDNTLVAAIADVLKQAPAVTANSFDDVKKAKNSLFKYNNLSVVVTKSGYDILDTLKDGDERYLLQDSIAAATGKTLLGLPVYVIEDTRLGAKEGDAVMFVGDVKAFALVALFKDLRVKWTDNDIYGEKLQLVLRDDEVVADTEAGKLVTLNIKADASNGAQGE